MADNGYPGNVGKLVVRGKPFVDEVTTGAATVFPGALLQGDGTTDNGVILNAMTGQPVGWAGWEHTSDNYRVEAISDTYATGDRIANLYGGHFAIQGPWLAPYMKITKGDLLIPGPAGTVYPANEIGGRLYVKLPYAKSSSGKSLRITMPAGVILGDVAIYNTGTVAATATIQVGTSASANEYLTVAQVVTNGWNTLDLVNTTNTNSQYHGSSLAEAEIKTADSTAQYFQVFKSPGYVLTGSTTLYFITASDSSDTTSTLVGYVFVGIGGFGIAKVARALTSYDNSAGTSAVQIPALSLI